MATTAAADNQPVMIHDGVLSVVLEQLDELVEKVGEDRLPDRLLAPDGPAGLIRRARCRYGSKSWFQLCGIVLALLVDISDGVGWERAADGCSDMDAIVATLACDVVEAYGRRSPD